MKYFVRISVFLISVSVVLPLTAQQARNVAQGGPSETPATRKISIDLENVSLREAVAGISRAAGVTIGYSMADLTQTRTAVSIHGKNITVVDALKSALAGTGLQVKVSDHGEIDIVRSKAAKPASRQGVVVGRVTDAKTGKAISGANISISGDTRGFVTDDDGTYRIVGLLAGTHTISVRLVGYARQSRQVILGDDATVTVDFKLETSANILDQVIVTGTVVQTELKAVPTAITVVTAKQIEERGITRIDQLFRGDIPGLFSLNLGSGAQLDEVTMFSRGGTAILGEAFGGSLGTDRGTNPIKTYIDGVEMANPAYLSQIDPSSIERIEILTGPQASTIYGSNAINGVMQIFTKRGSTSKPRVTLSLNSGVVQNSFSNAVAPSYLADASVSGTEGRWSYNGGGSWNYMGSWTPGKQNQRLSAQGGGRAEFGKLTADMSARQGLTKNRQNGGREQIIANLRATGFYTPTSSQGARFPTTSTSSGRTLGLTLSYHPYSWWSHVFVVGSDVQSIETMKTGSGFFNPTDSLLSIESSVTTRTSENYSSTVQLPISSLVGLNLTFGADHWRSPRSLLQVSATSLTGSFSSDVFVQRARPAKNTGAFVQGQLGIFDALFFTYGIRTDWNPNFGEDAEVKPGRYGASYSRDIDTPFGVMSAKVRGSYGRAIRPPVAGLIRGEVFLPAWDPTTVAFYAAPGSNLYLTLPNADLGPEFQQGGEGGIELYFGSRGSIQVTRYNQTVDGLITKVRNADSARAVSPGFNPSGSFVSYCYPGIGPEYDLRSDGYCYYPQDQYLNVGSIRNQGWELQSSINFGPLTTQGTYSWVKSRVLGITPKFRAALQSSNPEFEPGRPFDYLPEHNWALNFKYSISQSTISLALNGVGMRYVLGDAVSLTASSFTRLRFTDRSRSELLGYRPLTSGYTMADLNAIHRFSPRIEAMLQIANLADRYVNDYNAEYATAGRSSRVGVRVRW